MWYNKIPNQRLTRRKEIKMRFLVTTTTQFPIPPEMAPPVMDGMIAWFNKYTQSGKIETGWSDAGRRAGGGILNVDSLEELDAILTELPIGPFSEVEVQPIVDLLDSIERGKQAFAAMAGG
jgi:muconolactone delta-isomerase